MNELKKSIHDNANGLDYTLVNDHYLPNLTAAAPAEQHVSFCGFPRQFSDISYAWQVAVL